MKFCLMAALLPLVACTSVPAPLGGQTLDSSDFDFATPVSGPLPERYIHPEYEGDYIWTLEDRTVKYAVARTDESNVLKLEIERDAEGRLIDLCEGDRKLRTQSCIFVLDKG